MKWFNLSLLLVVIALGAVLVFEPALLTRLLGDQRVAEKPLPESLATIKTLKELTAPLTLIPNPPTALPPAAVKPAATSKPDSTGQAQTRELKQVAFAGQQLDGPIIDDLAPANPESAPAVPVDQADVGDVCYQYGPLKDFDQVTAAGDLLIDQGLTGQWAEIEMPYSEPRYWVVLDEAGSRQQAREWVKKLDDKKFGDHYLPLTDDEPHLISLGIFKTAERAERHRKALQSAGFPVKFRPKSVELSRRWITFESGAEGQSALTGVLTGLGIGAAQVAFCEEVAKPQLPVAGQ